jgi:CRP-like cAMP-binding protein
MGPVCRSLALGMEKQLAQLDFFRGVAPVQMKMLVTMFHFVPLVQGDTLFRENDFDREMGNSLYFLYKGRVRVTNTEKKKAHAHELASHASETTAGGGAALASSAAAGVSSSASPPGSPLQSGLAGPPAEEEKTLNILEPGCFFGEVGLLLDIPRTATIVAEDSSLLLELSQKNFRHFITIVPDMLTKFNTVLLEYNIHLRWFLANPLVLSYFITHCKAEFSTENIEFWMACREFRKFVESGEASNQAAIDARAMEIKAKYIGAQAEHQVNLKGSVESKLLRSLASGSSGNGGPPISATVFVDAEEEILGLMSSDSFGRFKSSELFKSCIETVNSPYTAILRKLFLI